LLKYFFILFFFTLTGKVTCQTVIWSEDFDGNSGLGSNWGTLNQPIGGQGNYSNLWYISCRENGEGVGNCGCDCNSGCGTNNNSLHLSSLTAGDLGAAYDAGGLCGFGLCTNTDKRTQSVNINTIGQFNLSLNIEYMENGQGFSDNGIIEYSINGGTTWFTLTDPAKTTLCLGGQGQWTALSIALPASCENIANLRIGFRWQNNDDALGTDPSFAIDNISITKPIILPVDLVNFTAKEINTYVELNWSTLSENNTDFFTLQRSIDGRIWKDITTIKGQGFSSTKTTYSYNDFNNNQMLTYYRLKQTDFNGVYTFSEIILIEKKHQSEISIYPNPTSNSVNVSSLKNKMVKVELFSQTGQLLISKNVINKTCQVDLSDFKTGIYILKITSKNGSVIPIKFPFELII
jgi:hypothetical protein